MGGAMLTGWLKRGLAAEQIVVQDPGPPPATAELLAKHGVRTVPTPHGEARLHTDRSRHPIATLVLGHGAGGGIDSRDLEALAATLPRNGITVVRVEQP